MRIQLLGATRLHGEGGQVDIASARQRRLLARLAVNAPQVIHIDALVSAVWPVDAPTNPTAALRTVVTRLRATLDQAEPSLGERIVSRPPGYLLAVSPGAVDLHRFEELAKRGADELEAGRLDRARASLDDALECWQGPALAEFADEEWAIADATRLEQRWLRARALRLEIALALAETAQAVPDAYQLVADDPFDDRPRALLMRALCASGRQADALRIFEEYRRQLVEEAGLEPGPDLRDLERRILADDPMLLPPARRRLRGYRPIDEGAPTRLGRHHRALQPGLDREVWLEVIDPAVANDPDFVQVFEARCQALSRLAHARVQPIIDYWRDPDGACLVRPALDGPSLADPDIAGDLGSAGRLRVRRAIEAALRAAHAAGVGHGPIRPEHVRFDEAGEPVLEGFDLTAASTSLDEDLSTLDALFEELGEATQTSSERVVPNPYRGLETFLEVDAELFFGRDRLVSEVLDTLAATGTAILVGPSGSGKSSAVRAGVVPALRSRDDSRNFVITMTPGERPFVALELAIMHVAVRRLDDLDARLRSPDALLGPILRELAPDRDATICLVIDQLEELFTAAPAQERDDFLELVSRSADSLDARLLVIATLRADHYDRPLAHPGFASLCKRSTVAVDHPSGEELRAAIEGPAKVVGVDIDADLVARLIADTTHRPGGLPLLQYALTEVFDRRDIASMSLAVYERLGGLTAAIGVRAEATYGALDPEQQSLCRAIFGRLVEPSAATVDVRRRATIDDLAAGVHGDKAAVLAVVNAFVNARLLSTDHDTATRTPTVDVAHEALFREWPRLRQWLEEDREALLTLRSLSPAAHAWHAGHDDGDLLGGRRLAAAAELRAERPELLTDDEHEFVHASEEADLAARRARDRQHRRLRGLLVVASLLVVALAAAGGVAISQRNEAKRSAGEAANLADIADAATLEAEISRMTANARELRATEPDLGTLLAVAAHRLAPSEQTRATLLHVLTRDDGWLGYLQRSPELEEWDWGFSSSTYRSLAFVGSRWLVGGGDDGLHIWDLDRRSVTSRVLPYTGGRAIDDKERIGARIVAVAAIDETHAVAVRARGSIHLVDVASAVEVRTQPFIAMQALRHPSEHAPRSVTFDRSTGRTAVSTQTGELSVVDEELEIVAEFLAPPANALALRGDLVVTASGSVVTGRTLPAGETRWQVDLADLATRWDDSSALEFAEDGSSILYSFGSGTVVLDSATGDVRDVWDQQQDGPVSVLDFIVGGVPFSDGGELHSVDTATIAISPDGQVVAVAEVDRVSLWSVSDLPVLAARVPTDGTATGASVDAGGRLVAWQGWPSPTAGVWDLDAGRPAADLAERTTLAAWQPSGSLVTAATDGSTVLWSGSGRQPTTTLQLESSSAVIGAPDGAHVLVGARPPHAGRVQVVDARTGVEVAVIDQLVPGAAADDRCSMLADVTFSPDGASALATTYCGPAVFLDPATWTVGRQVELPDEASPRAATYSPDGQTIALHVTDGHLYWLDSGSAGPTRGPEVGEPSEFWHTRTLAYVDGSTIAVGIADGVRLWSRSSGQPIGPILPNEDLMAGALSHDGHYALSGVDGDVLVWPLDVDAWITRACRAANRDLTDEEWDSFAPARTRPRAVCPG